MTNMLHCCTQFIFVTIHCLCPFITVTILTRGRSGWFTSTSLPCLTLHSLAVGSSLEISVRNHKDIRVSSVQCPVSSVHVHPPPPCRPRDWAAAGGAGCGSVLRLAANSQDVPALRCTAAPRPRNTTTGGKLTHNALSSHSPAQHVPLPCTGGGAQVACSLPRPLQCPTSVHCSGRVSSVSNCVTAAAARQPKWSAARISADCPIPSLKVGACDDTAAAGNSVNTTTPQHHTNNSYLPHTTTSSAHTLGTFFISVSIELATTTTTDDVTHETNLDNHPR